jgi:DNA-binding transcriptional LysR family regulator
MGLLEADLGLELFHRVGRSVRLTQAGEVILLEARALLNQAQALDLRARKLSHGQTAKLCVAIDEACPIRRLPGCCRSWRTSSRLWS